MFKTINNDEGSLKVGTTAGADFQFYGTPKKPSDPPATKIKILGEAKIRTVTYVMGSGEKTHLCFKGQGKVEMGEVQYEIVDAE